MQFDVGADRVLFRHLGVEGSNRITGDALGRHNGLIGSAQYVRRGGAPRYAPGDADTDGACDRLTVHLNLLVNLLLQLSGQRRDVFGLHGVGRHNDKLITPEACDDRRSAGGFPQKPGEGLNEPVASLVTEVVIDCLETVQVKEHQCDWTWLALSESAVEVGDQGP